MSFIPRVGVAVLVYREIDAQPHILMGTRKGSHGAGSWAFPGGHLEWFESVEECGSRELLEETGMVASPASIRRLGYTDTRFTLESKHYITLLLGCSAQGDPVLREPEKCGGWRWCLTTALPKPLFDPIKPIADWLANLKTQTLGDLG